MWLRCDHQINLEATHLSIPLETQRERSCLLHYSNLCHLSISWTRHPFFFSLGSSLHWHHSDCRPPSPPPHHLGRCGRPHLPQKGLVDTRGNTLHVYSTWHLRFYIFGYNEVHTRSSAGWQLTQTVFCIDVCK